MIEFDMTAKELFDTIGPFSAVILAVFLGTWLAIGSYFKKRRRLKREEFPHTMSEQEYTLLNEKRFSG